MAREKNNGQKKSNVPANSGKAPSFQFYYKDWLSDQRLRRASYNAKGVWIDLICLSMDMPIPGVFGEKNNEIQDASTANRPKTNQKPTKNRPKTDQKQTKISPSVTPLSKRQINNLLIGDRRKNNRALDELIQREILKQTPEGVFFVKRIYEDMRLREIRREAGKKGGSPLLLKQNPNLLNQTANQTPTPSTSTSISLKYSPNSEEFRLAQLLGTLILKRKPDHKDVLKAQKDNWQKWAVHTDRMMRLDNRSPDRIEKVIRWCQQDTGSGGKWRGWQNNILCTETLRGQFDQLELRMQEAAPQATAAPIEIGPDGLTARQRLLQQSRKETVCKT